MHTRDSRRLTRPHQRTRRPSLSRTTSRVQPKRRLRVLQVAPVFGCDSVLEVAQKATESTGDVSLALAECYTKTRQLAKAAGVYDSLRSSQGDKAAYWFNLGYLKQQSHDNAAAEAAYRKCLEIDGNDLDALTNLGMMLSAKAATPRAKCCSTS